MIVSEELACIPGCLAKLPWPVQPGLEAPLLRAQDTRAEESEAWSPQELPIAVVSPGDLALR